MRTSSSCLAQAHSADAKHGSSCLSEGVSGLIEVDLGEEQGLLHGHGQVPPALAAVLALLTHRLKARVQTSQTLGALGGDLAARVFGQVALLLCGSRAGPKE